MLSLLESDVLVAEVEERVEEVMVLLLEFVGLDEAALSVVEEWKRPVTVLAEDSVSVSLAVLELSVSLAVDEAVEDVESSLELALLGAALLSLSITKGGV